MSKEFVFSLISLSILCLIVNFLSKVLKIRYKGFKFSNPQKSALYAMVAVTITSAMITVVMILVKSQNASESVSNTQQFSLNGVINIAIVWLVMLSPILIEKRIKKESWESTGISMYNLKASIFIGVILGIITILSVILFSSKSLTHIVHELNLSSLWALLYYAVVGFCEEFMFRGYLQTRLIGWIGKWKGWILTSIVMALIHIPQRMAAMGLSFQDAIISSVLLIPISLTMGYIMLKTENIVAPGIYHTFANWVNVLM